ncbi:hypothetical protein H5U98_24200 [Mycolicibacterium boenickei]|uniref:Uncharacterized protein n=2 Tax=Mycolicibacterium boenickei TaxID=146017 RepID=A0AAX2ZT15_9MYCO|nr:hypothetical protein [Mycolicibacterium boenickei]PEG62419.1 hypothetical protein CQY21_00960 [Mycolicibacterium boenickei]UNB98596.1 hypothetical protein H5U98_24200 [Mycolicibacterium boenickei]BBX94433.1 hypothetical protein MBOE_60820 [Mycolicibacterium boenickei]
MAQTGDVAGRLDQGQPAVDTFAEFAWACALLGYQHPDLTVHAGQLHDWYATEDGLDLRMLDADCTALTTAAEAAEQALRLQDEQLTALDQAWQGRGAQAAREFLYRHAGAAQQAVAAVRGAADVLAALRDQLWRAVDTKVAVTERIEARCAGQRQDWLAAARTVRTGLGDRDLASELIDAQVKPFVANDIGSDWVPAMRSATAAVSDAYAAAITALSDGPAPAFEIPGDLGPSWTPRIGAAVPADPPGAGARTVPAGFAPSPGSGPAPWASQAGSMDPAPPFAQMPATAPTATPPTIGSAALPESPMAPATSPAAADPAAGWGSALGNGGLPGTDLSGGGLSGLGSGASGLGRQLADLFGGLIGAADGSLGSSADTALPELDAPETSDELDDADDADDAEDLDNLDEEELEPDDDAAAEDVAAEEDAEEDEDTEAPEVEEVSADAPGPAPAETTVAPAAEPQPVAAPGVLVPPVDEAAPAGETPCAIAADELPQVGS